MTCVVEASKLCQACGSSERSPSGRCRPCGVARAKAWRLAHPGKQEAASRKCYLANKEKHRARDRKWRLDNPEKARSYSRKANRKDTGWLPGEHERAEAALPSVIACGCCGNPDPRSRSGWQADHSHESGKFRSHLCHPCNIIVGFAEKYGLGRTPQIEEYLEKYRNQSPLS